MFLGLFRGVSVLYFKGTWKDDAPCPVQFVSWHKHVHSLMPSPGLCQFCSAPGSEELVGTARAQCMPSEGCSPGAAALCTQTHAHDKGDIILP